MPSKRKTPHEGGAIQNGSEKNAATGNTEHPVHRQAALALLVKCPALSRKEAGFLGNVCVARQLSDKQRDWLERLLAQYHLPPLHEGGAQ